MKYYYAQYKFTPLHGSCGFGTHGDLLKDGQDYNDDLVVDFINDCAEKAGWPKPDVEVINVKIFDSETDFQQFIRKIEEVWN